MLCYRCGGHVKDGSDRCPSCGQPFALGLKPGSIAGFGTGSRRGRAAIEGAPYKLDDAVANRFQIKDHLGAGPLGWVFRAVDTESGESVSFKVLSPRFLQLPEEQSAFRTELSRMQALEHGNIARTIASGLDGTRPWIASQLLDGLTLRRIMDLRRQKGQGFALIEIEPIVAQIAAALDASPVAHGNLKPDNVVVLPDLLKLTDFGLSLCLPRAPFVAAQRAAGVQRYFAPELLAGAALGGRADVFSLGVMLGELLGGAPFDPHIEDRIRAASVPEAVERVFLRAVAPRPEERFSSAADLSAALSDAIHGEANPDGARGSSEDDVEVEIAEDDDVVIEHAQTDPRVRLARALAAQDAERSARAKIDGDRADAANIVKALPTSLPLSLTPLPPLSVPPLSLPPLSLPPLNIEMFSAPPPAMAAQPAHDSASAQGGWVTNGVDSIASHAPAAASAPARETNGAAQQHGLAERAFAKEGERGGELPGTSEGRPEGRIDHGRGPIAAHGVRGQASAEEVARVAARVGATPELLTAETAVRFAPTAPPSATIAAAAPEAATIAAISSHPVERPLANAAGGYLSEGVAAPMPLAARGPVEEVFEVSEISDVSDASDAPGGADVSQPPATGEGANGSDEVATRGKRRGRGRRGRREEGRGRRPIDSAPPPPSQPPAAATATGAQTHAPEPLPAARSAEVASLESLHPAGELSRPASPASGNGRASAHEPGAAASTNGTASPARSTGPRSLELEPPAAVAEISPERESRPASLPELTKPVSPPPLPIESRPPPPRLPAAPPSFGALAQEKRGLPIPLIAVGTVLLIAAALFGWNQLSNRGSEEKPAVEESSKTAPASKAGAPPAAPATPGAAATPAPANAAAPAQATSPTPPTPTPPAPVESATSRAKEPQRAEPPPARDLDERPAKGGKKSFLERLRERRDASKHGQDHPSSGAKSSHTQNDEAEPAAAASGRVATRTPAPPVPAPVEAAAAPAPAPATPPPAPPRTVQTSAAPTPVAPNPAAPSATAAAAPAASPNPGGIAGIDDDNLMASRDPEKRKRAAARLAVAAGAAPAPAAAAPSAPVASDPCIEGMQLIAGGTAHVGTDPADDMRNFGDRAPATVQVKAYCIDLYEWPNAAGRAPKTAAGFAEADASCKKSGKRLCSEDEWEKACKGPSGLRFPYGAAFDPDACNTQDKATNPRKTAMSGAFASCKSGYGVYDLSGNVAEWTSSSFDGAGADKAVKGGSASRPGFDDRCSSRRRLASASHDINVGFRCCADAR